MGLARLVSNYSWRFSWIVNLDSYYIMPIVIHNGIQYNVAPSAIGAKELTVTTPEVEVVGKAPLFDSNQSAFKPNELIQDVDYIAGSTIGKVLEPVTKIPGAMPVLRTLTPSNWIGTIRTGEMPWGENNKGFGTSENDQALNSLFNWITTPVAPPVIKGVGKGISKVTKPVYNIAYNTIDRIPTGFRPTMQYTPNTLYRLIGTGDKGYRDLLQSGIVRGNMHPRGLFTTEKLHGYMRKLSRTLSEEDLRALSSDNYTSEAQFNRINKALEQLYPPNPYGTSKSVSLGTWEGYLKAQQNSPTIQFASTLFGNKRRNPWLQNWIDHATGGANKAISEVEWSNLPTFSIEQSEVLDLLKQDVKKGAYVGDYGVTISNADKYATPFVDGGHFEQHPTTKIPITLDNPDLSIYKIKRGLLSRKPYMVKLTDTQIKKDLSKVR